MEIITTMEGLRANNSTHNIYCSQFRKGKQISVCAEINMQLSYSQQVLQQRKKKLIPKRITIGFSFWLQSFFSYSCLKTKCRDTESDTGLDWVSDDETVTNTILLFCNMVNKITKSHDC